MNGKILSAVTERTSRKRKVLNDLLEQKYIDLVTTYDRLRLKPDTDEAFSEHLNKIDVLFGKEHNWDNASAIEQMLAPMYNETELDIEIRLNLVEVERRLSLEVSQFFNDEYAFLTESADSLDKKNGKLNLLCNIYKKLQISYDLEEQKKYLLSSIRFSTSVAFLISIIIFFVFDNIQVMDMLAHIWHEGDGTPLLPADKSEFTVAAFTAGWMGSCFSMLVRMKGGDITQLSIAELAAIKRMDNLISRSLIGMVSGLLILYAFEGQFIQGVMFPELSFNTAGVFMQDDNSSWTRNKAHAMLVFWCFLAGFSEKMVPDLLGRAEKQSTESA